MLSRIAETWTKRHLQSPEQHPWRPHVVSQAHCITSPKSTVHEARLGSCGPDRYKVMGLHAVVPCRGLHCPKDPVFNQLSLCSSCSSGNYLLSSYLVTIFSALSFLNVTELRADMCGLQLSFFHFVFSQPDYCFLPKHCSSWGLSLV